VTPQVIAHRGASGLAYENSASAFRLAVESGADGIELDIHATADGALVVHHDPVVQGLGRIADHTTAEIGRVRLPNGEALPVLADVLRLVDGVDVWIEVKSLPARYDARLFEAIDQGPTPARYAVHGFDHRIVARLGQARPSLSRGVLLSSYLLDPVSVLEGTGARTLWQDSQQVDQDLLSLMHRNRFRVIAWTANEAAEIRRLADLSVDGICTNFPDRTRSLLQQRPV
jgi:glycerophosphoryl diester phosphodiesterase